MKRIPYQKEELESLCKESDSYNEILVKTGRVKASSNIKTLKKYIELYNIDVSYLLVALLQLKKINEKFYQIIEKFVINAIQKKMR